MVDESETWSPAFSPLPITNKKKKPPFLGWLKCGIIWKTVNLLLTISGLSNFSLTFLSSLLAVSETQCSQHHSLLNVVRSCVRPYISVQELLYLCIDSK